MATKEFTTKKVKIEDLKEGDEIKLEGRWRKFALVAESRTVRGHVNIMVSNTAKRFFRVKDDTKVERKEEL